MNDECANCVITRGNLNYLTFYSVAHIRVNLSPGYRAGQVIQKCKSRDQTNIHLHIPVGFNLLPSMLIITHPAIHTAATIVNDTPFDEIMRNIINHHTLGERRSELKSSKRKKKKFVSWWCSGGGERSGLNQRKNKTAISSSFKQAFPGRSPKPSGLSVTPRDSQSLLITLKL